LSGVGERKRGEDDGRRKLSLDLALRKNNNQISGLPPGQWRSPRHRTRAAGPSGLRARHLSEGRQGRGRDEDAGGAQGRDGSELSWKKKLKTSRGAEKRRKRSLTLCLRS